MMTGIISRRLFRLASSMAGDLKAKGHGITSFQGRDQDLSIDTGFILWVER